MTKFDFLVEVKDFESKDIKVTIGGQPAEKFFSKKATVKSDKNILSYRIDEAAFTKAGALDISVEYTNAGKNN